jgi:uncharacterized protein (DUF1810 family)
MGGSTDADPFDLQRFVDAQAVNHAQALEELIAGRKRTHWSWYVLPQLRGLGTSPLALRYGIGGLDEARAYLAHPVLGARLQACVAAIGRHPEKSAETILGAVDALKYHACLTLFCVAAGSGSPFEGALRIHFGGARHARTLEMLGHPA